VTQKAVVRAKKVESIEQRKRKNLENIRILGQEVILTDIKIQIGKKITKKEREKGKEKVVVRLIVQVLELKKNTNQIIILNLTKAEESIILRIIIKIKDKRSKVNTTIV